MTFSYLIMVSEVTNFDVLREEAMIVVFLQPLSVTPEDVVFPVPVKKIYFTVTYGKVVTQWPPSPQILPF